MYKLNGAIACEDEVRSLVDENHRLKVEFGRLFRECLRLGSRSNAFRATALNPAVIFSLQ